MSDTAIDACCLIDLLGSGHAEEILQSWGQTWHLPVAVQTEVKYIRRDDPAKPGQIISVPADLQPLLDGKLLLPCQVEDQKESDLFVQYAANFRSDGEAMCLALAEHRGWKLATDDRKAIRVAQQAGVTVVSCPELVKHWATITKANQATVTSVIESIERYAQFRPNTSMAEYQWWQDQLP